MHFFFKKMKDFKKNSNIEGFLVLLVEKQTWLTG